MYIKWRGLLWYFEEKATDISRDNLENLSFPGSAWEWFRGSASVFGYMQAWGVIWQLTFTNGRQSLPVCIPIQSMGTRKKGHCMMYWASFIREVWNWKLEISTHAIVLVCYPISNFKSPVSASDFQARCSAFKLILHSTQQKSVNR